MNATPEGWPGSRAEQAKSAGVEPEFPPVPIQAMPLLDAFMDLGMVESNGMGLAPLPYAEIAAGAPWADLSERQAIRGMSRAYLAGREIGKDAFGIPPWGD